MDSGSCRNVTHPKTLPAGVKVTPDNTGNHFSGAGGEVIEKLGECMTNIGGAYGKVGCRWNVADVTRPLHSVSQIAGPPGAMESWTCSSTTSGALWYDRVLSGQ